LLLLLFSSGFGKGKKNGKATFFSISKMEWGYVQDIFLKGASGGRTFRNCSRLYPADYSGIISHGFLSFVKPWTFGKLELDLMGMGNMRLMLHL
jgi:hypothetical protein